MQLRIVIGIHEEIAIAPMRAVTPVIVSDDDLSKTTRVIGLIHISGIGRNGGSVGGRPRRSEVPIDCFHIVNWSPLCALRLFFRTRTIRQGPKLVVFSFAPKTVQVRVSGRMELFHPVVPLVAGLP